jgi:hypothetical protein
MVFDDGRVAGGSLWAAEDAAAVVRRVWYATPAVGAAMVAVAYMVGSWRDAVGVVVGAGLAMVNFRSLQRSLRSILDSGRDRAPTGTTMMFVFRWIIVATIAYAIIRTGYASGVGIIAGFFAPAAAIGFEAVFQLAHALRQGDLNDEK